MRMAQMKRYDAYKDSGIEWLGEVPSHWAEVRIKDLAFLERGKFTHRPRNDPQMYDGIHPFIQTGDVARANKYVTTYKQTLSDKGTEVSRKFRSGTLLMAIAANIGDVAIVNFDTYFPDSVVGFKPIKSNVDYLFYLFTATRSELDRVKVTSTQENLNLERLNSLVKFSPPLLEQVDIATYLDSKTTQIDLKIDFLDQKAAQYSRLKQSLINETVTCGLDKSAPKRNCNVHLIREVPEHWKICRLKEVGYLYGGLTGKSGDDFINENECSEPFIPFTNIANNFYLSTSELKSVCISPGEKQNFVKKYDLFFLMSSEDYADLGKSSLLRVDMEKKTYLNSFCKGFRFTKHAINPSYINYLLHSTPYRVTLSNEGNGFTRINLRMEKVNDLQILIPPVLEQQAISKYLDEKTAQIDCIIQTINSQIDKLKDLRKALIKDVVTGKIKIVSEG